MRKNSVTLETPVNVSFFAEGEEYTSLALSAEGSHCAWLTLDPQLLLDLSGSRSKPFSVDQVHAGASLTLRQRSLFRIAEDYGRTDPLMIEEESIALVEDVLAGSLASAATEERSPLIDRARERLAVGFATPLSLAEIARDLGVSQAYLSRCFRRITGQTMHAFREGLRLRLSLDLLPDCAGDFSRLALDLGYSSHSHFSSRFRKFFGIRPADFVSLNRRDRCSPSTRLHSIAHCDSR